jgi:hypothetical protein
LNIVCPHLPPPPQKQMVAPLDSDHDEGGLSRGRVLESGSGEGGGGRNQTPSDVSIDYRFIYIPIAKSSDKEPRHG